MFLILGVIAGVTLLIVGPWFEGQELLGAIITGIFSFFLILWIILSIAAIGEFNKQKKNMSRRFRNF